MHFEPGIIKTVAEMLIGQPNQQLSTEAVIRYGTNGSLSIKVQENTFFDHEQKAGGGVLDLILSKDEATTKAEAFNWLKDRGIAPNDTDHKPEKVKPKIVATYDYQDETGALLFQVARYEPKTFKQRKPDGNGGWDWKVKGVRQVPYRLPELLAAPPNKTVYIVEGEKDVNNMAALGLVSTCNAGGAGKWRDSHSECLKDRPVIVVIADNDDAGRDHAQKVAKSLRKVNPGMMVRVLELPGLPEKGDVSDWLDAGGTVEELAKLKTTAPEKPAKDKTKTHSGFVVSDAGVFKVTKSDDEDVPDTLTFICSRLDILAQIRSYQSNQWGRLLRWNDPDNKAHEWAMPMSALQGDGADIRRALADGGLRIATSLTAKNALVAYLSEFDQPNRARGVDKTGWHPGKNGAMVFAFPDETIGEVDEIVRYQSDAPSSTYTKAGTLAGWQTGVAALCVGNSRYMMAVSAGFAAMLLQFSGLESGGINLRGDSSTGKTTALRAAASVFGGPGYVQRWRATGNGIEATATQHNDTLLLLDELKQVDPKEAGEIAYMLANGQGKHRAKQDGKAKPVHTWRLLFLSAGEISLAQHMASIGKKIHAGQEVRLIDLPAAPATGHGMFEELHGFPDGPSLSEAIQSGAEKNHGIAATEFIRCITEGITKKDLEQHLKTEVTQFVRSKLPDEKPSGQAWRVCERFALIGVAGELATANGITQWPEGEAIRAAGVCFDDWLKERGSAANSEAPAMIEAVRSFIAKHEEGRFTDLDAMDQVTINRPTHNRAGWRRNSGGGREYLIDPGTFRTEICQGFDHMAVARELVKQGYLETTSAIENNRYTKPERIPGAARTRVYVVNSKIMED